MHIHILLHPRNIRIVEIDLIQILDKVPQTRKRQHNRVELEQEAPFLGRFIQRIPKVRLPSLVGDFLNHIIRLIVGVCSGGHNRRSHGLGRPGVRAASFVIDARHGESIKTKARV